MRAFALDDLGETGSVRDLPLPEPGPGEVRVRVHAAGLNAVDAFVVSGMGRGMMEFAFPLVPGLDLSGVVDAVGSGVDLPVGSEVFGAAMKPVWGHGALAEFVVASVGTLAQKPPDVSHGAAGSVSVAGRTALAVMDAMAPKAGQTILVVGATGGVGSFTVPLLAQAGVTVIATGRPENADYARALGAAEVVDYTKGDLLEQLQARFPDGIDGIADLASNEVELTKLANVVRSGGVVVSPMRAANDEILSERGIRAVNVAAAGMERHAELASLLASGRFGALEVASFPLDRAAEALALQATRHVRGKVVVTVG